MSDGSYRMVWYNQLINSNGYIHKHCFTKDLFNADSALREHVIEVYAPNEEAGYFDELIRPSNELIEPSTEPIWRRYDVIYTNDEAKNKIGIPKNQTLYIIK